MLVSFQLNQSMYYILSDELLLTPCSEGDKTFPQHAQTLSIAPFKLECNNYQKKYAIALNGKHGNSTSCVKVQHHFPQHHGNVNPANVV